MVRDILPIVKDTTDNLLILGKAGVGKSTLIKVVKRHFGKNVSYFVQPVLRHKM